MSDAIEGRLHPFTWWLLRQRDRDDPIGDLARDVANDNQWPSPLIDGESPFCDYLAFRGACIEARAALRTAWAEYGAEVTCE